MIQIKKTKKKSKLDSQRQKTNRLNQDKINSTDDIIILNKYGRIKDKRYIV